MSLIIEIEEPLIDSARKFEKALGILMKATGRKVDFKLDNHSKSEPTPYTALRQHADEISDEVEHNLYVIWEYIVTNWMGQTLQKAVGDDMPFRMNGKIMIDPKSGLVLTKARWKAIQTELTKMFKWLYGSTPDRLVNQAIAMGKLVQQMDPAKRITVPKKDIPIDDASQAVTRQAAYRNVYNWADVHTGELITDVTDRSRRAITNTIMQGYQDGISQKQLQQNLFDEFSVLNRDWRRIAETETATNFNNGYLTAELEAKKPDEEHIFMIGISGAGACSFCASHVADHVVVLLDSAPAGGDTKTIDGRDYTAVWPGKSNVGKKKANWWVSSGSQHPHCRCTWTRYYPAMEKYLDKLKQATGS